MNPEPDDDRLFAVNARLYHQRGVVRQYRKDTLARADAVALLKYRHAFAGKDVLDIGVGTGRTAIYLAPLARRYQAIDYSPAMVRQFEHDLPGVPIELADMRDLSRFPGAGFDFVLASNNVIDAVGHEDRLRTLREMRRVLRPGGILMFSSHNRGVCNLMHGPRLHFSRNPVKQLVLVARWGRALFNHARLRRLQTFATDYAILNDEAHDCALLQYYIGLDAQRRQLQEQGFELVEGFDNRGIPLPFGSRAEHSRWLLYVARRLAGTQASASTRGSAPRGVRRCCPCRPSP
jgi:SAM-dependent methyltransferase